MSGASLRKSDQRGTASAGAMCMNTWTAVPGSRLRKRPWRTAAICDTASSAMAPTLRGLHAPRAAEGGVSRVVGLLQENHPVVGVADHRAVRQQRRRTGDGRRGRCRRCRWMPCCVRGPQPSLRLSASGATGMGSFSFSCLRPLVVPEQPLRRFQHQVHPVPGDQVAGVVEVGGDPHPLHLAAAAPAAGTGASGPRAPGDGFNRTGEPGCHACAPISACRSRAAPELRDAARSRQREGAARPRSSIRAVAKSFHPCVLLNPTPRPSDGQPHSAGRPSMVSPSSMTTYTGVRLSTHTTGNISSARSRKNSWTRVVVSEVPTSPRMAPAAPSSRRWQHRHRRRRLSCPWPTAGWRASGRCGTPSARAPPGCRPRR